MHQYWELMGDEPPHLQLLPPHQPYSPLLGSSPHPMWIPMRYPCCPPSQYPHVHLPLR